MNKFAVSATDIGDMIERDGSALAVANNTLAQSIALGTAMNETIQDAATSGTTLKVLSLRIRGVKTELEDMGEGTDGVVENTSKLEAQVKALTNVNGKGGVEIMADANNFKSTYQIIKEIGSVWKQMSDVNQAALLEILAGKTRANGVAALLENYQQLDKIVNTINNDEGSAMAENAHVVDSLQGRINILSASSEEFWKTFIKTDLVKQAISLATSFLDVITKVIDKAGVLPTLATTIAGLVAGKNNIGRPKMFGLVPKVFKYANDICVLYDSKVFICA